MGPHEQPGHPALETKLHPHFFFNSLNAISVLVRKQENALAVRLLALLPLVENAIRHGISRRPGAGLLEIRAAVRDGERDGMLVIEVHDDGPGPAAADIESSWLGPFRERRIESCEMVILRGSRGSCPVRSRGAFPSAGVAGEQRAPPLRVAVRRSKLALFVMQGDDRVDARRPACRHEAGDGDDQEKDRHDQREGQWIGRGDAEQ